MMMGRGTREKGMGMRRPDVVSVGPNILVPRAKSRRGSIFGARLDRSLQSISLLHYEPICFQIPLSTLYKMPTCFWTYT